MGRVFADGAYGGPKLRGHLERLSLSEAIGTVEKPKDIRGFTVLHRRWVVERTFAWMGRCRRLAKDFEASAESVLAWSTLADCVSIPVPALRAAGPPASGHDQKFPWIHELPNRDFDHARLPGC